MPKNSFLQAIFPGPKFSLSPIEKTNKGTIRIGEVVPVYKTMLNPREKVELNLGHLVRFSPTVVPVMEGYEVNFEAFAVPVSALGYAQRKERDIMDFHNLALNEGEITNPSVHSIYDLYSRSAIKYGGSSGRMSDFFRPGALGDFMNLPSFKNFRDFVRRWIVECGLFEGGLFNKFTDDNDDPVTDGSDVFDFVAHVYLNDAALFAAAEDTFVTLDASGRGYGIRTYLLNVPFPSNSIALSTWRDLSVTSADDLPAASLYYGDALGLGEYLSAYDVIFGGAPSFVRYLFDNYPLLASYYGFAGSDTGDVTNFLSHLFVMREANNLDLSYLDKLYDLYKIDAQSAFDEYFEYIMSSALFNPSLVRAADFEAGIQLYYDNEVIPDVIDEDIDLTYFAAYWKIISDWYINTNIDGDPNEFFIDKAGAVLDPINESLELKFFNRRWANDPFTSSVPSAKVTNVLIPTDGTIPQLREANAYQRLKDILRNVGNRLSDVVYGLRGIIPANGCTDMSQPVGALRSYVGMQSVLQTSQTSKDSPLASYAGIGTDSSRGDYRRILKVVNNDEAVPVVVMVLMSITQRASYFQGLPRYFTHRSSIYDFAIPQLANIGEQEIHNSELYCDMGAGDAFNDIFGFNRRYYDWFFEDNEIHGNMRDSEDMWHGARIFSDKPALNSEFIEINSDRDDLNRIFANLSPVAQPIYYNVYFEGAKVVSLPRYIQYDL